MRGSGGFLFVLQLSMALQKINGSTSQSVNIYIQNTSGAALTGLAFNTAGLICYYSFTGAIATSVSLPLVTLAAVTTAWTSAGFKEIDATHMPGMYRFDIPNAAIAVNKVPQVTFTFSGASTMAPYVLDIQLLAVHSNITSLGTVKYFY